MRILRRPTQSPYYDPPLQPPRSIGSDGCQGPIDVGHRGETSRPRCFFYPGAIENGHRNSGFSHGKMGGFSSSLCKRLIFQRVSLRKSQTQSHKAGFSGSSFTHSAHFWDYSTQKNLTHQTKLLGDPLVPEDFEPGRSAVVLQLPPHGHRNGSETRGESHDQSPWIHGEPIPGCCNI